VCLSYWGERVLRRLCKCGVTSLGLTRGLLLELQGLSEVEVGGIPGVAVNCVEIGRNTSGEGGLFFF